MKMIGLIGGMSWESTLLYYRIINNEVAKHKGGLHSAPLLMYSFDFEDIVRLQKAGAWTEAGMKLAHAGNALKAAGARALVICTNTMHIVARQVESATGLPVIHIADCTGEEIRARGIRKVGLIGTKFTMEQPFYRQRMEERYGIEFVTPEAEDRAEIHRVIFEELCKGVIRPESKRSYQRIIASLRDRGAEGVIFGCTEICLLLDDDSCEGLPVFNTTHIHAMHAARFCLQRESAPTVVPLLEAV